MEDQNEDFAGYKGMIGRGDLLWMTAGRRIAHSEMPVRFSKEQALRLQLWLNLPKEHNMCEQQYQEFLDAQISCTKSQDGVVIKAIAGDSHGVKFQIYTRTPAMFFELYDLSVVTVVVDGSNLHGTSTRS